MEQPNQNQQELMFKLSMFEQQIQQLQQQTQAVEQAIIEMNSLIFGLDDLKESKDKEIFASIGKGIFVKAKILSEDLIVDVGGKKFVKKSIGNTQKMIDNQIQKLEEIKKELNDNLEKVGNELVEIYTNAQNKEENK